MISLHRGIVGCKVLYCLVVVWAFLLTCTARDLCKNNKPATTAVYSNKSDGVCISEECYELTRNLLDSINSSIDPCEDFYEFACGGWIKNNPIPNGKALWNNMGKMRERNEVLLKELLEDTSSQSSSSSEEKARELYQSCMDKPTINARGVEPLQKVIAGAGGWNISGDLNMTGWDLHNSLVKLHYSYRTEALFYWGIDIIPTMPSYYKIMVHQPKMSLPLAVYYKNNTEDVINIMTKIGVLLGGRENETRDQMREIFEFERTLVSMIPPKAELRSLKLLQTPLPITHLQDIAPFIDWIKYLNAAFTQANKTIASDEKLVFVADYFRKLAPFVADLLTTESGKIRLQNYLIWRSVMTWGKHLSQPFVREYSKLAALVLGTRGVADPWRDCISITNSAMGFAVGAIYVKHVFEPKSKVIGSQLVKEIRAAFLENFKHLDWMDEDTLKATEEKANAVYEQIGYPEWILSSSDLDKKYKHINVNKSEYFQNMIQINQVRFYKSLMKLNETINKKSWDMPPFEINAFYSVLKNRIEFPAGILQPPFFHKDYPASLNFGSMGFVIAHELTHAFDDKGRKFDSDGTLRSWWKPETIEYFKNGTQCFAKQYSNYSVNSMQIKSEQTMGENIADNGGIKTAYHAYLKFAEDHPDLVLPQLNMTGHQLFFLNFAQIFCSALTPEKMALKISEDEHAPSKWRVVGSLRNFPQFSEAFQCSLQSYMNPTEKCSIW